MKGFEAMMNEKTIDFSKLIPQEWYEAIRPYWKKEDEILLVNNLSQIIRTEEIAPKFQDIFKAFELCSFDATRVVILGQDPYPTLGHAHGLSFSVPNDVEPLPKSLKNIFKEIKRSIPEFRIPKTGDLTSWAEQGVLMLNTILTTQVGVIAAHKNCGWETFTRATLRAVNSKQNEVIGLFWGAAAQKMCELWRNEQFVLKSSHPSPLSVYRGFDGCNHFSEVNKILTLINKNPIDWNTSHG
ncbi:MAG: uracil-DNA glycosylase [Bacteroidetes bacterium]|nr:uracil-DNA glycosylase [Bacteroidota bacterium]